MGFGKGKFGGKSKGKGRKGKRFGYDDGPRKGGKSGKGYKGKGGKGIGRDDGKGARDLSRTWRHDLWQLANQDRPENGWKRTRGREGDGRGPKRRRPLRV